MHGIDKAGWPCMQAFRPPTLEGQFAIHAGIRAYRTVSHAFVHSGSRHACVPARPEIRHACIPAYPITCHACMHLVPPCSSPCKHFRVLLLRTAHLLSYRTLPPSFLAQSCSLRPLSPLYSSYRAIPRCQPSPSLPSLPRSELFLAADLDSSGYLDRYELANVLRSADLQLSDR